jgi:hypothetical protein
MHGRIDCHCDANARRPRESIIVYHQRIYAHLGRIPIVGFYVSLVIDHHPDPFGGLIYCRI